MFVKEKYGEKMNDYPIDFIITWVDGNDPEWQEEKAKYKGTKGDSRNSRYRDWDTLKYLFRGIEKNAPWVNKVYLVTCGHIPAWLDTKNPKLKLVKHSDYIPAKYLPTFSSRTIDMNFHRIDELSEHFVYFNDDMLLMKPVSKEDFFVNGVPCDTAVLRPAVVKSNKSGIKETTAQMYLAPIIDMALINKYINKHQAILNNFFKWYNPKYGKEILKTLSMAIWNFFPGIREYHCCYSYLKSTYKNLWAMEEEAFNQVCEHRFRVNTDYNHWVFSYWQIANGDFYPRNPKFGNAYSLSDNDKENKKILSILKSKRFKLVCINDSVSDENYSRVYNDLNMCLEAVFPDKSKFEI